MSYPITITEARHFPPGTTKFLGIKFTTPDKGIQEGTVWEPTLFDVFIKPGTALLLEVGQNAKTDPVAWDDYKGKVKLNIRKGAEIAYQASVAQPVMQQQPVLAAYQPPQGAIAGPVAHQPAYTPAASTTHSGGIHEQVMSKVGDDMEFLYHYLKGKGLPEDLCVRGAAAGGSQSHPLYWFGEKGLID